MGGNQLSAILPHLHSSRRGDWLYKGKFLII